MGFPVVYTEIFLPKFFIHLLSLLGFIRSLIITLFHVLGLSDFVETDISWHEPCPASSAAALREILPVMKLEQVRRRRRSECCEEEEAESCAVCLCEIEEDDEIRWLENCKHIFHRCCLDRWMDHDQTTCPICRAPFLLDSMKDDLVNASVSHPMLVNSFVECWTY